MHLVAPAPDHVAVEAHQEPDLVGRPGPVLGGEGVGRDRLHADLDRPLDHVEQRVLAALVARRCAAGRAAWPSGRCRPSRSRRAAGTSSGGIAGGRAPDGCGVGRRTSRRVLPRATGPPESWNCRGSRFVVLTTGSVDRPSLHCIQHDRIHHDRCAPRRSGGMDTANEQIEQQITVLLRRVQRIHLSTAMRRREPRALRLRHHVQAGRRGPAAARRARHRVRPRPLHDHPPGAGARGDRPRVTHDRPLRPARVDPRPHPQRSRGARHAPAPTAARGCRRRSPTGRSPT